MSSSKALIARRIAEAVSAAWYSATPCAERIDIPLGAVAALALIQPLDHAKAQAMAATLRATGEPELLRELERLWDLVWVMGNPYLVTVAAPVHDWIRENPDSQTIAAVRSVMTAALDTGIHELTGDMDPAHRSDADLLGEVLTALRAPGARKGIGEYHTPPDIAELAARMVFQSEGGLREPGTSVLDCAVGTGDLIRGAAQAIRAAGGNPADYRWVLGDINPLAAAACAVNAFVWGLGPDVLIYCADSLADPTAPEREAEHRHAVLAHYADQFTRARCIAATRDAMRLLGCCHRSRRIPGPALRRRNSGGDKGGLPDRDR
ncbi:N-6 DNA methylase [Nocardia transvalensis]|uniref:N-6 DNA methylase n=1 Tax=Nocardia transvalensis TaxID=37333 RepID=UPI0018945722|nr:N-6 DNA methylase [Nocardia transvalensis]MBF6333663.1 N-6 DNA methylase [Nocardia transvalensis]